MDAKGKERGILKLDPRPRVTIDTSRSELTPQGSYEHGPVSPQPSVDRLSVTWADPGSMASSGVNLFHRPSDNEVQFSPGAADGSEDEDYSVSLSAVLRQRRASVRRSRKGRARRPSSPFLPDENRPRRRSSVFTTSSGDTAISVEEVQPVVTQEQIFENIHLHKEVLGSVKQQPLGMRRKLKIVHQAKAYIKRHEGQLQERLAQSKCTRDIYARFTILMATKWQQMKREAANTSNLLIPWELRIKEIESHFGSVVASYFTFLRWLFWVNLVIGFILLVFVIVPEYLIENPEQDGERKIIMPEERRNATNLLTLWEFEGVLKCSAIFYGYYSNVERSQYRMPLAYFLTGLVVYIYSFVAILRKMAENSRMSKLSEKEDECIFSWKLFTGWDFMIGNAETAHNRIASVILGFKEALLEEAEKKKDLRNWRIISLRALVNMCVVILLVISAYAVVTVVSRSDGDSKVKGWWRENETTIVVTVISITFPVFFELLGFLEHYHPRKQLRLQLARIMLLNLLNLYSLIFALFSKIEGMSKELDMLKPNLSMNANMISNGTLNISETLAMKIPTACYEEQVPCGPCTILLTFPITITTNDIENIASTPITKTKTTTTKPMQKNIENNRIQNDSPRLLAANLIELNSEASTDRILSWKDELNKLRNLTFYVPENSSSEVSDDDDNFDYSDVNNTGFTEDSIYQYISSTLTSDISNFTELSSAFTEFASITAPIDVTTDLSTTDVSIPTESSSEMSSETTNNEETTLEITSIYNTGSSIEVQTDSSSEFTRDFYSSDRPSTIFVSERPYKSRTSTPKATTSNPSTLKMMTESFSPTQGFDLSSIPYLDSKTICPNITFNCSVNCGGTDMTQIFFMSNCTTVKRECYVTKCDEPNNANITKRKQNNITVVDVAYLGSNNRTMYNLTKPTKKKLLKLCWETMFGQELVKLTMMDLVFVLLGTLFMDFFRALFVRYMNRCWCWDLEKRFPEYGDFKIAENILHLINNQGMVWMGMFFSPGIVVLNVAKLMIMMYLRSWAVMTCNVPHEVVFRVSKSNNFYLSLLLTMLFLCVLPVGYTIVWVKPSWHCGPFSEYDKIYYILTNNIYKLLPKSLNFALEYIASPAIVIPLLVLLILIIYYLTSLTNSLREANNDLKIQLRRERTEERRKMFQLADTRRQAGSSAMDNTPFARWKKALPTFPLSKSIDSDERKTSTGEEQHEPMKSVKKRGGIFAKIVGMALDKKTDVETISKPVASPDSNNADEETDTDFHETLPKELLKIRDIVQKKRSIFITDQKKRSSVEFKNEDSENIKLRDDTNLKVKLEKFDDRTEKKAIMEKRLQESISNDPEPYDDETFRNKDKKLKEQQISETSNQSKQSDSISSVIPVIMISTTESDEEGLHSKKEKVKSVEEQDVKKEAKKSNSDLRALRRQSSVDSINEQKPVKQKKLDEGHKYQYSL